MPDRCCVRSCTSNFNGSQEYVSVFQFPKDEVLRKQWLKSLHLKHSVMGKRSVVCQKHFAEEDVVWTEKLPQNGKTILVQRIRPKLKPRAVPTRFLGCTCNVPKRKIRRVCELHFNQDDFVTEASAFDEKKGVLITAPLKHWRLKPTAIPSIFPRQIVRQKTPEELPINDGKYKKEENNLNKVSSSKTDSIKKSKVVLEKMSNAVDSPTKVFKNKRRKPNPPTSETDQFPCTESSSTSVDYTDSSSSSLLDPNIVIKKEVIEPEDEVPNVAAMDHTGDDLSDPGMIPQEKSPSDPTHPAIPALVVNDTTQPILTEVFSASSIRDGISELLANTTTLEPTIYHIVNFSNNLPNISVSSPRTVTVNEKTAQNSKSCSTVDASTSTDGKIKDQFDAYGKYIAAKLRSMDAKTSAFVQKSFGEIIFKAEMEKFLLEDD